MHQQRQHPWNLSPAEAIALQRHLAREVRLAPLSAPIRYVAGADLAYSRKTQHLVAAVCVLDAQTLEPVELKTRCAPITFPYIPGLLSFREAPAIAHLLQALEHTPDLLVCDGQGIAHPRRFGIACHLGLLFDLPTIGCAKTRLFGKASEPGRSRGDWSPLYDRAQQEIGRVLRTRTEVRPLYVSPGHRITCAEAADWILRLTPRFRLPETTRITDRCVTLLRQQLEA